MAFADSSNRRTFLGALSALSAALMSPRKLFAASAAGEAGGGTPREVGKALREGKPSIALSTGEHGEALSMTSFTLQPGEEKIIAGELVKLFRAHLV